MRKADITYQDKLNELRLALSHPNNRGVPFILVEGVTDIRFYRKFFDLEKCKVESLPGASGKIEECIGQLVADYPNLVGIQDSDFIYLEPEQIKKPNLFLTDDHDIEMMTIMEEEVLSSILFEYSHFEKNEHEKIRKDVLESIECITLLRILNAIKKLELHFEFGFSDILEFDAKPNDCEMTVTTILARSPNAKIRDQVEIKKLLAEVSGQQRPLNFRKASNGHDFMKALACFLRKKAGRTDLTAEILAGACRVAFTPAHFAKTRLYAELQAWAKSVNVKFLLAVARYG